VGRSHFATVLLAIQNARHIRAMVFVISDNSRKKSGKIRNVKGTGKKDRSVDWPQSSEWVITILCFLFFIL
jgi:hypothetical protein